MPLAKEDGASGRRPVRVGLLAYLAPEAGAEAADPTWLTRTRRALRDGAECLRRAHGARSVVVLGHGGAAADAAVALEPGIDAVAGGHGHVVLHCGGAEARPAAVAAAGHGGRHLGAIAYVSGM